MFLHDDAIDARARLMLAHGAGAPMDHPWMNDMTAMLVARRISVARFEFGFMASRRDGGKRKPAPRGETLVPEYSGAIAALQQEKPDGLPTFIGGKSLGGRVASLVAAALFGDSTVGGCVCLGYPFHPPKKPDRLRTAHLRTFDCPLLIVQGTRDLLGSQEEVAGYELDPRIEFEWLQDGDHDLKPRKSSGFGHLGHLASAAEAIEGFVSRNV